MVKLEKEIDFSRKNKIFGKSASLIANKKLTQRRLRLEEENIKTLLIQLERLDKKNTNSINEDKEKVDQIKIDWDVESQKDLIKRYDLVNAKLKETYSLGDSQSYLDLIDIKFIYHFLITTTKTHVLKSYKDQYGNWINNPPSLKLICQFTSLSVKDLKYSKEINEINQVFNTVDRKKHLYNAANSFLELIYSYLNVESLKNIKSGIVISPSDFSNEFDYLNNCLNKEVMKKFRQFVKKIPTINYIPWESDDYLDEKEINQLLFWVNKGAIKEILYGNNVDKLKRYLADESKKISNNLYLKFENQSLDDKEIVKIKASFNSIPTVSITGNHSLLSSITRQLPTEKINIIKRSQEIHSTNFGHLYVFQERISKYIIDCDPKKTLWDEIARESSDHIDLESFSDWYKLHKDDKDDDSYELSGNEIEFPILSKYPELQDFKNFYEKSNKKRGNVNHSLRECIQLLGYNPKFNSDELQTRSQLLGLLNDQEDLEILDEMLRFITELEDDFIIDYISDNYGDNQGHDDEPKYQRAIEEAANVLDNDCLCIRTFEMEALKQTFKSEKISSNQYSEFCLNLSNQLGNVKCMLYSTNDYSFQWMDKKNKKNPFKTYKYKVAQRKDTNPQERFVILTTLIHAYGLKSVSKYIYENVKKLKKLNNNGELVFLNNSSTKDYLQDLDFMKVTFYNSEFLWDWPA